MGITEVAAAKRMIPVLPLLLSRTYPSTMQKCLYLSLVLLFWNFSEIHEKNILADLAFSDEDLLINPIDEQDIETEEFHYEYDHQILRPRIYNDMITLRSADHLIKLTMSYAIAQLTKLELLKQNCENLACNFKTS